jgi:hypothetical protein
MTISASSLSHALHGMGHHTRPSGTRTEPFAQQLKAAQTGSANLSAKPSDQAGAVLSSDMLQAIQTIR